jgi:type I restriction enzyme, S subunit
MTSTHADLHSVLTELRNGLDTEQFDEAWTQELLPISRIETISEGVIDFNRVKFARVPPRLEARFALKSGDILFSHINSPEHIGKSAIFRSSRTLVHGINLLLLRVDAKRCHPEYLNYFLKSARVRALLRARCKKAVNQASLNHGDIGSLRLPLPAIDEQRSIAAILERADRIRRLRRCALELGEGYLQSVFLEMFGDGFVTKPARRRLGELVTITGGGTPSRDVSNYYEGHIPWLTSKDMKGDYIFDTQEHITEQAIRESATKLVPANSVLVVVKSKVLMHRLPVAVTRVPLCHGQDIKSIQSSVEISPAIVVQILKQNEQKLLHQARGANTEGLTLPMLEEISVPVFTKIDQARFSNISDSYERIRTQQREAMRQAEHLFQTLLHRAFCGEF